MVSACASGFQSEASVEAAACSQVGVAPPTGVLAPTAGVRAPTGVRTPVGVTPPEAPGVPLPAGVASNTFGDARPPTLSERARPPCQLSSLVDHTAGAGAVCSVVANGGVTCRGGQGASFIVGHAAGSEVSCRGGHAADSGGHASGSEGSSLMALAIRFGLPVPDPGIHRCTELASESDAAGVPCEPLEEL